MGGCAVAHAAEAGEKLRVGISPFAPFVTFTDKGPEGAAIDAWQVIAQKLGSSRRLSNVRISRTSWHKLQAGAIDVAIGGISITEEREKQFDFTNAQFHTGLDILVRKGRDRPFLNLLSSLFSQEKIPLLLGMLILIVLAGHVVWLAERSTDRQETTFSRTYIPGVFEGMYWALVTASTIGYGDKVPHRWTGRLVAALVILISLPLFGFFIAQMSSDLDDATTPYQYPRAGRFAGQAGGGGARLHQRRVCEAVRGLCLGLRPGGRVL